MIKPRVGDAIYNHFRLECGKKPYGVVVEVPPWKPWMDRDEPREILVRYFPASHPSMSSIDYTFGLPGGDTDYMTQDAYEECRVSSEWQGFDYIDYRTNRRKYHERGMDNRTVKVDGESAEEDDLLSSVPVPNSRLRHAVQSQHSMVTKSERNKSRMSAIVTLQSSSAHIKR